MLSKTLKYLIFISFLFPLDIDKYSNKNKIFFLNVEFKVVKNGTSPNRYIWLHGDEKTAEMVGSVEVKGFEDILVEASDLKIFYEKALVKTRKPVFLKGGFGIIEAGSAEFYDMNQKSGKGYVLLFDKGVKMLYGLEGN